MATSLTSRSRRPEYGRLSTPSSATTNSFHPNPTGVAPYPSPVSFRSSTTTHLPSSYSTQQAAGVSVPGAAPGNASKGSRSQAASRLPPPPPSQDFRQYAQHFPPLSCPYTAPPHHGGDSVLREQDPASAACAEPSSGRVLPNHHHATASARTDIPHYRQQQQFTLNHPETSYYQQQHPQNASADFYRHPLHHPHHYQQQHPDGSATITEQVHSGSLSDYCSPSHYYAQSDSLVQPPTHSSQYHDYMQQQAHETLPSGHHHQQPRLSHAYPNHYPVRQPYPQSTVLSLSHHATPPTRGHSSNDFLNADLSPSSDTKAPMAWDGLPTIRVRAVLSGWKAGTIIGRQGQVISNLRSESQCKITVSDDPTTANRVLTVMGPPMKVADVLRRVCYMVGSSASAYYSSREKTKSDNALTESSTYNTNSTRRRSAPQEVSARPEESAGGQNEEEGAEEFNSMISSDPLVTHLEQGTPPSTTHQTTSSASADLPPISFTLAVPSNLCGCLIGRAGRQIKHFRQTFGVAFAVSSHSILESSDRPVNISGSPENVANCLEEVCNLFSEPLPLTSLSTRSQPQQEPMDSYYEASEGERTSYGAFRSNWRRNLSDADAADQVHHHGESEGEEERNGRGVEGRSNGDGPRRMSLQQYDSKQNIKKARRRPSRRHPPGGGGAGPGPSIDEHSSSGGLSSRNGSHGEIMGNAIEECSFTLDTGETEVHLLVPNDIVGCIIGKGGHTISEIRAKSGAMISITEPVFPPPLPLHAVSSTYPSSNSRRDQSSNGEKRGLRSRDRVICIRGHSKNIRTARYLMGSSILSAQKTISSSSSASAVPPAAHPPRP